MKKVLLITGINLYINSSVCLANAAYIDGFVKNGCDVTVIMPDCDAADKDLAMQLPNEARYLVYHQASEFERKIANKVKVDAYSTQKNNAFSKMKTGVRKELSKIKQIYLSFATNQSLFKNSEYFINNVIKSCSDYCNCEYDLIVSISSPVSSHHLAEKIIKDTNIRYRHWCQLWEDPWFNDLYTTKDAKIYEEEKRLLSLADSIEYVSPLTWKNQSQIFEEYASKMRWAFLPCHKTIEYPTSIRDDRMKLGYFGEYVSTVRDIRPLAEAVSKLDSVELIACGNTDLNMSVYHNVTAYGRVSIEQVDRLQEKSDLLVNISNLRGGQIPGKVYQYAGTNKPILFILDGSPDEKQLLLDYFGKYNRFVFCNNDAEEIKKCLITLTKEGIRTINEPVNDFSPFVICKKIMEEIQSV